MTSLEEHLQKIVDEAAEEAKRKFQALIKRAAELETYFPDGIDMRRYGKEIKEEQAKLVAEAEKLAAEAKKVVKKVEDVVEEVVDKVEEAVKPKPKKTPAKKPAAKKTEGEGAK